MKPISILRHYNGKVFEKGICHPFQNPNNKLANYFLQNRKIGFGGKRKSQWN